MFWLGGHGVGEEGGRGARRPWVLDGVSVHAGLDGARQDDTKNRPSTCFVDTENAWS